MRGILADANIQGHLAYLLRQLATADLLDVLESLPIEFRTFPDLGLDGALDDRSLRNFCQAEGWVLLTDNRNRDDPDSLEATLADSWKPGDLPVLTLANKPRFERDASYALRTAIDIDIADLLLGIKEFGESRDCPRLFVPRSRPESRI